VTLEAWHVDTARTRDLAPRLLDARGQLRVVPAAVLADTTPAERLRFGVEHGIYGFLTAELVAFLQDVIGGRRAIEIGAGHGRLAAALGIPATDNRQQEEPGLRAYYASLGQPTVRYGDNVEKLDAAEAVARHRPQVVVAAWVTHRYDADRPEAGGSETGVDEAAIVAACDAYVFIGNTQVHQHKPILALPHRRLTPSWLQSRAINGTPDFIGIWERAT
jgi:hypothetical protein